MYHELKRLEEDRAAWRTQCEADRHASDIASAAQKSHVSYLQNENVRVFTVCLSNCLIDCAVGLVGIRDCSLPREVRRSLLEPT